MSRFKRLSHSLWHCQYHIVWTPKCRIRILEGEVGQEVTNCIRAFSEQKQFEIIELNVQKEHVHLIVMVPPKLSISDYMGIVKGRTAIRVFNKFRKLKKHPYWGNHFWARGYCVDTVGLDAEKIRQYVKYQEAKERQTEGKQQRLF
jgi:putative transposase